MKKQLLIFALLGAITGFWACDGGHDGHTDTIDRKPFLEFTGNNVVLPSYEKLTVATAALSSSANAFAENTNAATFQTLKNNWKTAYLAWQGCGAFEFGPADEFSLRANLNIFPTDTALIASNIASGTYNLDALGNRVAKGFPALDYLLYGLSLESYTTGAQAANHKAYIKALATDIHARAKQVHDAWKPTGGNYIATFVGLTGTDQGSSLSMVVNKVNEDYEIAKNFKIGLPAGIKSLGQLFPEKAEAYYSGISLELAKANVEATQRVFLGQSPNGQLGAGLESLLAQYKATALIADIKAQFPKIFAALEAVPAPLSGAVSSNPVAVQTAYNEMQHLVVFTKAEMSSVLGVQISYQDGDND